MFKVLTGHKVLKELPVEHPHKVYKVLTVFKVLTGHKVLKVLLEQVLKVFKEQPDFKVYKDLLLKVVKVQQLLLLHLLV